jgi:hypothetical protein
MWSVTTAISSRPTPTWSRVMETSSRATEASPPRAHRCRRDGGFAARDGDVGESDGGVVASAVRIVRLDGGLGAFARHIGAGAWCLVAFAVIVSGVRERWVHLRSTWCRSRAA